MPITKYASIETVKNDSVYINRIKYDSIYHKNSIYMLVKGDTVYKYQYWDKLIRYTGNITKRDSIPCPIGVVKTVTVEKKRSCWQTLFIWNGGVTWIMVIIALIAWAKKANKLDIKSV